MAEGDITAMDQAGRLNCDLTCPQCGHNLRGLLPTGVCVECGHPIQRAMRSTLAYDRAAQLRRAVSGLTIISPWLWLPLSWPVALVLYWKFAAQDPAGRRGQMAILIARYGLFVAIPTVWMLVGYLGQSGGAASYPLIIFLTAVMIMVATLFVALRHAQDLRHRALRIVCRLALLAWIVAAVLLALASQGGLRFVIQLSLIGLLAVLAIPILYMASLIMLWRALEVAEIEAQYGCQLLLIRAQESARRAAATAPSDVPASATA